MKRVTGLGGIFFKANNADTLRQWYKQHLGIDVQDWGGAVFEAPAPGQGPTPPTTWLINPADSEHFAPSASTFMVNYRVDNLAELLAALRAEGCHVLDTVDEGEYGSFGWVLDPEGNKVELWQPPS